MPINIPDKLPAIELLKQENIFIMQESNAIHQDIRPLKIILINLMPLKIITETDLIRLLSNTPLQIEIEFVRMKGCISKNTPQEHLITFYKTFDEIKHQKYDGMIITGAPLGMLSFDKITYWDELTAIFDWSKTHVTSSMFICWAALAALNYFYQVPKYVLDKKLFGVFKHHNTDNTMPIFRGFDDQYFVPHSRYTEVRKKDIQAIKELSIIAESDNAGIYIVMHNHGQQFFVTGHAEYSRFTLDMEYKRDIAKNIPIAIPQNYYPDNNPNHSPIISWKGHANLFFANWLNYYVYQKTPYQLN